MTVFIIEKQLHKVGVTALVGYVLAFLLHLGRNSWFKGPDDFEYV